MGGKPEEFRKYITQLNPISLHSYFSGAYVVQTAPSTGRTKLFQPPVGAISWCTAAIIVIKIDSQAWYSRKQKGKNWPEKR